MDGSVVVVGSGVHGSAARGVLIRRLGCKYAPCPMLSGGGISRFGACKVWCFQSFVHFGFGTWSAAVVLLWSLHSRCYRATS